MGISGVLSCHRKLISVFILGLITTCIFSQTYFFDNYKTTDGMESSKVYSICQTNDGFVWLGTDVGLTRFDGFQFQNYTIKNHLGQGGARVLFNDNNVLWIGHEGGEITRFKDEEFQVITIPEINTNITSLCLDKQNVLWITTYGNGVFKIENPKSNLHDLIITKLESKAISNGVFNSFVNRKGELFLITDIDIQRLDSVSNRFVRHNPPHLDTYFQFSVIFEDSQENLWYGTYNGGLYKQDQRSGNIEYYDIKDGLASNWITSIIEDKTGNIWIGHWDMANRGGITRISAMGEVKVFNTDNGLHDNKIWCLYEDLEGNILAGTTEHGLDIFKGEHFVSYTQKNGLVNDQVTAITKCKYGSLWIGTNSGITTRNLSTGEVNSYTQEQDQISNQIRFLMCDQKDNIWLGSEDQGVEEFNFSLNRFVSKPDINRRLPRVTKAVWSMEIDQSNVLWIGTLAGLLAYDINKQSYIKTYGQIDSLPSNEIKSLYCDRTGRLWVGTQNGGLSYFEKGYFKNIPIDENVTPISITENSKNQLIVGTEAHGVIIIQDREVVKKYTINDGLYTNNSRFVITDNYDNIYVGTTVGLNKIIEEKEIVISYSKRDGFVGIEAKPNACFKDDSGKLWFGTVSGLVCYDPSLDKGTPEIPITHIIDMYVNGEKMNLKDNLVFPSYKNNVVINYSSISISDPSSVKYKIQLSGADNNWENVEEQRMANYRALPPGKYKFKVLAFNSYGVSVNEPAIVKFVILAPLYRRPWFIILSIVLIIVAAVIIVYVRERNLQIEKKVLAEKVADRTKELKSANAQLAERNKDITDSIYYARRIQLAITQPEIPFSDTFVLFQPKDIVSGDFYWASKHNQLEYLSAIDCTGHGVPGAFMSVIGYTTLNKLIVEQGNTNPADILNHLNTEITYSLNRKEDDVVNDGMDMSLVIYNPQTRILNYAGAYNSIWIVRSNELTEIKANRFAIGRSTGAEMVFTNHEIQMKPNDMLYLFSDGFGDQFGGPLGKKFKTARLKKLVTEICNLPVADQETILLKTLHEWKGDLELIDDVLIIGRRFN